MYAAAPAWALKRVQACPTVCHAFGWAFVRYGMAAVESRVSGLSSGVVRLVAWCTCCAQHSLLTYTAHWVCLLLKCQSGLMRWTLVGRRAHSSCCHPVPHMSMCGPFAVGRSRVCVAASHKHRRMHELLTAATCWGLNLVELRPQASRALLLSVALPRMVGKLQRVVVCGLSCRACIRVLTYIWTTHAWVGFVLLVRLAEVFGRAQLHCTGLSMSREHAGQIHKRDSRYAYAPFRLPSGAAAASQRGCSLFCSCVTGWAVTRLCDMMQHIAGLHCTAGGSAALLQPPTCHQSCMAAPPRAALIVGGRRINRGSVWRVCAGLCVVCFMLSSYLRDLNVQLTGADSWCAVWVPTSVLAGLRPAYCTSFTAAGGCRGLDQQLLCPTRACGCSVQASVFHAASTDLAASMHTQIFCRVRLPVCDGRAGACCADGGLCPQTAPQGLRQTCAQDFDSS